MQLVSNRILVIWFYLTLSLLKALPERFSFVSMFFVLFAFLYQLTIHGFARGRKKHFSKANLPANYWAIFSWFGKKETNFWAASRMESGFWPEKSFRDSLPCTHAWPWRVVSCLLGHPCFGLFPLWICLLFGLSPLSCGTNRSALSLIIYLMWFVQSNGSFWAAKE